MNILDHMNILAQINILVFMNSLVHMNILVDMNILVQMHILVHINILDHMYILVHLNSNEVEIIPPIIVNKNHETFPFHYFFGRSVGWLVGVEYENKAISSFQLS